MTWANIFIHQRHIKPVADRRRACKCHCGCERRSTHLGMANGLAMTSGCELSMRRWVKDPLWKWRHNIANPDR